MFYPQERTPPDVLEVLTSASLLSVSEFQVFCLSYRRWFGQEADEATIESHFIPYMFRDEVPIWVRHFTRTVVRLDREGHLDPQTFGIKRRQANAYDVTRGRLYLLGLGVALVLLLILAEISVDWLDLHNCFFPPCY